MLVTAQSQDKMAMLEKIVIKSITIEFIQAHQMGMEVNMIIGEIMVLRDSESIA